MKKIKDLEENSYDLQKKLKNVEKLLYDSSRLPNIRQKKARVQVDPKLEDYVLSDILSLHMVG